MPAETERTPIEIVPDGLVISEKPKRGHSALGPKTLPPRKADIPSNSPGNMLAGRRGKTKQDLIEQYGGTAETEAAVKLGLQWLAKNQQENGLWSMRGPYSDGSTLDYEVAATAMALLAFQGAGYTHQVDSRDPYLTVVQRGSNALVELIFEEGQMRNIRGRGYSEALATIALCELYGMTKDRKFNKPCRKLLEHCEQAQSRAGGWRYSPRTDSDLSVTGWFVMALQSGRMAKLKVSRATLGKATSYLDSCQADYGSRYSYQPGARASLSMTAEGLLCRQFLGKRQRTDHLVEGSDYLIGNLIEWRNPDPYYWYYATQVCHHMGGVHWEAWNEVMREVLPDNQVRDGEEQGSWLTEPLGHSAGRLYSTCLCLYMLEVYYRHLPLYGDAD